MFPEFVLLLSNPTASKSLLWGRERTNQDPEHLDWPVLFLVPLARSSHSHPQDSQGYFIMKGTVWNERKRVEHGERTQPLFRGSFHSSHSRLVSSPYFIKWTKWTMWIRERMWVKWTLERRERTVRSSYWMSGTKRITGPWKWANEPHHSPAFVLAFYSLHFFLLIIKWVNLQDWVEENVGRHTGLEVKGTPTTHSVPSFLVHNIKRRNHVSKWMNWENERHEHGTEQMIQPNQE